MKTNFLFNVVRLIIIFLLAGLVHVSAASYSQTITLHAKQLPLANVLETIRQQTGYAVYANINHLKDTKPISIMANNMPLHAFLDNILEDQPLKASVEDKTIVLSRIPAPRTKTNQAHSAATHLADNSLEQQQQVTGRVVSAENGEPVSSISVRIKGTTRGTSTDADGNYRLNGVANDAVLVFSSIGHETLEIPVNGRARIDATLTPDTRQVSEVVVVAYGTQTRESITGSVASISAEDLESRVITNPTQALAGAAPGIQATSGNGQPGTSAGIRIRGIGSINAGSAPMYVVDGFPFGGSLADINANDIESISVLKDASSTALYGARAANGVIIITTKKGTSATPKLNVNVSRGYSSRAIPEYDMVGAHDYYPLFWTAIKNNRIYEQGDTEADAIAYANSTVGPQLQYNPFNLPADQLVTSDGKLNPNASLLYNDFDWIGAMSQKGVRNEALLDYSARQEKADYFVSLGYTEDNGFIIGSGMERISGRISVNATPKSWFKTGINLSGALVDNNNAAAGSDQSAIIANPFVFSRGIGPIYPVRAYSDTGEPVLDEDGVHMWDYGRHADAIGRPTYNGRHIVYETLLDTRTSARNSMSGRTFGEISFLDHFKFTANAAIDLRATRGVTHRNKEVGDGATNGGSSSRTSNEYRHVSFNQLLTYERDFGRHHVQVLAGHESTAVRETYLSAGRRQENLDGNIELANFVELTSGTGYVSVLHREAYLSRANYGFDNRIFVDASLRRDGSSRFGQQTRWGTFYSAGAAWVLSNEDFLKDISWLSSLKLKTAYGTLGNDVLNSYLEYPGLYTIGPAYNNGSEPGGIATQLPNYDLTWEVSKSFNSGVEFGLFNNRIDGSVEFFRRGVSRLLFDVPQGLSSVINTRTENVGSMFNVGWEVILNGSIIRNDNFRWDVQTNHTFVKNEITHLPGGNPMVEGTKRLEEGKDRYAFWLRQWYGADPVNGQALWLRDPEHDATTDGAQTINGVEVTNNSNHALYDYSGSALPNYYGSMTNTFTYKGVSLSFLLNFQVGGKIYDSIYALLMGTGYGSGVHVDALNSWSTPGENNTTPRLDIGNYGNYNASSTRFLTDATHLDIRNISLSYSIPSSLVTRIGLQRVRVFALGENIQMFSKRKGLNPNETFNGTNSRIYVPNSYISAGLNVTL